MHTNWHGKLYLSVEFDIVPFLKQSKLSLCILKSLCYFAVPIIENTILVLFWDAATNSHNLNSLNNGYYFLPFWRLGSPRSRFQQIWCLVRTCFLVYRNLGAVPSHGREQRKGKVVESLLIRTLIPFMRTPPCRPKNLPEVSPFNNTTLGIRISKYELEGVEHKHGKL